MVKLKREDIYLITKYSDWKEKDISKALENEVYSSKENWISSLQSLCLVLGIGFLAIGIMFFFAYNWYDLSKIGKFIIVEGVVVITATAFYKFKKSELANKILSTALAFLIGVMFAVYGQIYQTGANSFDFFLSWSLSITIIVLFTDFAVLWLLYFALLTTTFHFYVVHESSIIKTFHELLITYFSFVLIYGVSTYLNITKKNIPQWWFYFFIILITSLGTLLFIEILFDKIEYRLKILTGIGLFFTYGIGLISALKNHRILDFSCIIFSIIIMITAIIIKSTFDIMTTPIFVALFVLLSTLGLVQQIVSLRKKWKHESN